MSGTSEPDHQAIDQQDDEQRSSGQRSPSVIGLAIVSGLNIVCLAFITYHFTTHTAEPMTAPLKSRTAFEMVEAALPPAAISTPPANHTPIKADALTRLASNSPGNVDLTPASRRIISIAAGIDADEMTSSDQRPGEISKPEPLAGTKTPSIKSSNHWVQLGALSAEATARRYWSSLKARHVKALGDKSPRYFGPPEVGGRLYHIRLGPMDAAAAADLCDRLKSEGADCFCLSTPAAKVS